MGTGNTVKTDLYALHNYVQNTMVTFPKELFIETLREHFSQESYYHYQRDLYGYPYTPDHTDLPSDSGLHNDVTTRLFIGEPYRFDLIFWPALKIKSGGSRSVPISMNREKGSIQWQNTAFTDGYGNSKIFSSPSHLIQAGAWEGQIMVDIETRSPRARDELVDIVSLTFVDTRFDEMKNSGVLIKGVNAGGPSESDDRNDKLYRQTITFDIRSEWRRHIPIDGIVDTINICVDFGTVATDPPIVAPNLKVSTTVELIENLLDL